MRIAKYDFERSDAEPRAALVTLECSRISRRSVDGAALHTIRRVEVAEGGDIYDAANDLAVRRALEAAGVEFIDENGGGPGVRLRKSGKEKPRK